METQLNQSNGPGNWIAFLFGATFNMLANFEQTNAINYAGHALAGGIICLFFKMLGDFLTPLLKRLGQKFKKWIV